jgi:WS/DGAT/MGAT family acyltransferase
MPYRAPVAGCDPLSAEDLMFLACERAETPMHIGATLVFREGSQTLTLERLRQYVEARLDAVARCRQRLAYPAFAGPPVWVDDGDFELANHVRGLRVAYPGDETALRSAAARLLSQPLDRDRPLWELWLVDGLAGGRFAIVSKIHHCMADGIAGAELLALLLSEHPDSRVGEAALWVPRATPGRLWLLAESLLRPARAARALGHEVRHLAREPTLAVAGLANTLGVLWRTLEAGVQRAPASPLNRPIGPHRRVAFLVSDLSRAQALKGRLGGTVNDVLLAVVAGALRRFFLGRDPDSELVDLRAVVPVGRRSVRRPAMLGNHVSAWILALPVRPSNPLRRHGVVRQATERLKASDLARGGEILMGTNGTLVTLGLGLVDRIRPFNLVVSNVAGPVTRLHLLDAPLLEIYPHVPLLWQQGLTVAVLSYAGRLHWGFTADCHLVPDLERFAAAVDAAFVELEEAARIPSPRTQPATAADAWSRGDGAEDHTALLSPGPRVPAGEDGHGAYGLDDRLSG